MTVSTSDSPMLPSFEDVGTIDAPVEADHGDLVCQLSYSDSDVLSGSYIENTNSCEEENCSPARVIICLCMI